MKTIGKLLIIISVLIIVINKCMITTKEFSEKKKVEQYINETSKEKDNQKNNYNSTNSTIYKDRYKLIIEIPKIELKRGAVETTKNYNSINYSISIDKNSIYPDKFGDLILYSHSGNSSISYFKRLYELDNNDNIIIYYNGVKYEYEIFKIYKTEKKGQLEIIVPSNDKYITLITCDKDGNNQYLVIIGKIVMEKKY